MMLRVRCSSRFLSSRFSQQKPFILNTSHATSVKPFVRFCSSQREQLRKILEEPDRLEPSVPLTPEEREKFDRQFDPDYDDEPDIYNVEQRSAHIASEYFHQYPPSGDPSEIEDGQYIYTGPLNFGIKAIKRLSITSCAMTTLLSPIFVLFGDLEIPLYARFLYTATVMGFGFATTGFVHKICTPYVYSIQLRKDPSHEHRFIQIKNDRKSPYVRDLYVAKAGSAYPLYRHTPFYVFQNIQDPKEPEVEDLIENEVELVRSGQIPLWRAQLPYTAVIPGRRVDPEEYFPIFGWKTEPELIGHHDVPPRDVYDTKGLSFEITTLNLFGNPKTSIVAFDDLEPCTSPFGTANYIDTVTDNTYFIHNEALALDNEWIWYQLNYPDEITRLIEEAEEEAKGAAEDAAGDAAEDNVTPKDDKENGDESSDKDSPTEKKQ